MLKRTWAYGTRLNAKVEWVTTKKEILLTDERGEGHILVGIDNAVEVATGDNVVMEFTQGGPTVGYWRIVEKRAA